MTLTTLSDPPTPTHDGLPVVEVRSLTKSYADRRVLTDVALEVQPGEIFGILGPNGAGKTTLVEILQGLRSRDAGEVRVLGHDPGHESPKLRHLVGSQLQSSGLPDHLRVGEALRLFTRLADDVVDWRQLLADWELTRLERTAYRSLSGGERQRLFLALALVNRPRLVFLDELTQGLDPAARRETWGLIERIRDDGTTVVLVSHYMDEVERLCDRIGVLRDGRLDHVGTAADLVATVGGPVRTRFSATDRDWTAELSGLPGVQEVAFDGRRYDVAGDPPSPFAVARALDQAGCRPEDFHVLRPSLEDAFMTVIGGAQ